METPIYWRPLRRARSHLDRERVVTARRCPLLQLARTWFGFGFGFGLGFGLGAGFGIGFGFGVGFEVTLSDLAVAVSVPLLEELYRTLGALGQG